MSAVVSFVIGLAILVSVGFSFRSMASGSGHRSRSADLARASWMMLWVLYGGLFICMGVAVSVGTVAAVSLVVMVLVGLTAVAAGIFLLASVIAKRHEWVLENEMRVVDGRPARQHWMPAYFAAILFFVMGITLALFLRNVAGDWIDDTIPTATLSEEDWAFYSDFVAGLAFCGTPIVYCVQKWRLRRERARLPALSV